VQSQVRPSVGAGQVRVERGCSDGAVLSYACGVGPIAHVLCVAQARLVHDLTVTAFLWIFKGTWMRSCFGNSRHSLESTSVCTLKTLAMPKGRSGSGGGSRQYSSPHSRGSGVYTSSGAPVRNPAAYAATGARTYTSSGKAVSNPVAYSGAIEASVRQNTSSPKYFYHYTDSTSLKKIADSGYIKRSTGPGDCALGRGVCESCTASTHGFQSLPARLTGSLSHAQT
jgi:hypothetical protein